MLLRATGQSLDPRPRQRTVGGLRRQGRRRHPRQSRRQHLLRRRRISRVRDRWSQMLLGAPKGEPRLSHGGRTTSAPRRRRSGVSNTYNTCHCKIMGYSLRAAPAAENSAATPKNGGSSTSGATAKSTSPRPCRQRSVGQLTGAAVRGRCHARRRFPVSGCMTRSPPLDAGGKQPVDRAFKRCDDARSDAAPPRPQLGGGRRFP